METLHIMFSTSSGNIASQYWFHVQYSMYSTQWKNCMFLQVMQIVPVCIARAVQYDTQWNTACFLHVMETVPVQSNPDEDGRAWNKWVSGLDTIYFRRHCVCSINWPFYGTYRNPHRKKTQFKYIKIIDESITIVISMKNQPEGTVGRRRWDKYEKFAKSKLLLKVCRQI